MDVDTIIKIKSNDGAVFELSSKAASRSGLLNGIIKDYPEDNEFSVNVNGKTLEKVKDYLTYYQDKEPQIITKPLKSKKFEECANEWDAKFLDVNNDAILSLVLAANYLDIKPLFELTSAKIACCIRGTTTENIRKDFGINDLNEQEKQQIEEDKSYLEKNL